jgi:hypothetical protein
VQSQANQCSGGAPARLTIGKASDLRVRVRQGLIKGLVLHSSGKGIRTNGNVAKIVIRWKITVRPAAVEEELHNRHWIYFGKLPKYTDRT